MRQMKRHASQGQFELKRMGINDDYSALFLAATADTAGLRVCCFAAALWIGFSCDLWAT